VGVSVARTEDEAKTQRERGLSITEIAEESEAAEDAVALAEEALAFADDKGAEAAAVDGMVEEDVAERVAEAAEEGSDDSTDGDVAAEDGDEAKS